MPAAAAPPASGLRCAAHPARPAVDACPRCGRPRCGADASGPGCAVCSAARSTPGGRPPAAVELLVRAVLAAYGAAVLAGMVNSEYIGSDYFAYVAPAIAGVATGAAATAAAPARRVLRHVRIAGVALGVVAVALGFVLEGTYDPVDLRAEVLVPYGIAGAAAWLWTAPPRRKRVKASSGG
jgi:hypothetical protein